MENFLQYIKANLLNNKEKYLEIINNFFTSPLKLSIFLLCAVLFTTFVISLPYYQNSDDAMMRAIADGTLNHWIGPSNFLLYSSSFYGKILQILYKWLPNVYWYDLLCYTLQSIALFVTSFTIFDKQKKLFNIFVLLTLFFVYTPLFISIQFTVYSGILAIAAVSTGIYILKNKLHKFEYILCGGLILFLILFSGFVRTWACYIVLAYGCFTSLLLVKKDDFKKLLAIIAIMFIGFGLTFGFEKLSLHYAEQCENTNLTLKLNKQLQLLFNDTIAGASMGNYPWLKIEKNVPNLEKKLAKVGWTKGDYRLYLAWLDIGNKDIFSIERQTALSNILKDDILISKQIKPKFDVDNYNLFKRYIFIALFAMLLFFTPKQFFKPILVITSIYVLEILLSLKFRTTPSRLWFNFAIMMIVLLYHYIKYYSKGFITDYLKNNKKEYKILLTIILAFVYILFARKLYRPFSHIADERHRVYNKSANCIKHLDKDKVYIASVNFLEHMARPFKASAYSKIKILDAGFNEFPQKRDLLFRYNIPAVDTWNYICTNNNVEIIPHGMIQNHTAIKSHMKDRYNKDVVFVESQDLEFLKTYSCEVMTEEDLELAKHLKKAQSYNALNDFERNLQSR